MLIYVHPTCINQYLLGIGRKYEVAQNGKRPSAEEEKEAWGATKQDRMPNMQTTTHSL